MAGSSSPIQTFDKDPLAVLDYAYDWGKWLQPGEFLASVVWTVAVGLAQAGTTFSGSIAQIFLTGGTSGVTYAVYATVTTTAGRTDKRTIQINVLDR